MRIAHVLVSPRIGGAEQIVAGLNLHFTELGIHSEIFYLDPSDLKRTRLQRVFWLRRELRKFKADHVLAHSFLPSIYSRLVSPKSSGVHYVLHSASDDYRRKSFQIIERILHTRTKTVIAVAARQLDVYKSHFKKIPKSTVINNGVNIEFSRQHKVREHPTSVVTVARVAAQKRPGFWVEVARLSLAEGLNLSFKWWGPLSGDSRIDNLMLCGLPSNASYMGPTLNPEKAWADSDIAFHSSNREAYSLAIVEAAVTGKPQLCSDSLDLSEELAKSVFTFQENQPNSAVAALKFICETWPAAAKTAHSKAELFSKRFGMKGVARLYVEWLSEN